MTGYPFCYHPKDIVVVSIMPCTAKKFESTRPELKSDVDYVLTTREFARLIRWNKIDFLTLPDEKFDPALGIATGAGAIFGATGGVMEAALRTTYEFATGKKLTKVEFDQLRGNKGIKTGSIMINGTEIKFAAANGLANAKSASTFFTKCALTPPPAVVPLSLTRQSLFCCLFGKTGLPICDFLVREGRGFRGRYAAFAQRYSRVLKFCAVFLGFSRMV